jgi:hypothetical protein
MTWRMFVTHQPTLECEKRPIVITRIGAS